MSASVRSIQTGKSVSAPPTLVLSMVIDLRQATGPVAAAMSLAPPIIAASVVVIIAASSGMPRSLSGAAASADTSVPATTKLHPASSTSTLRTAERMTQLYTVSDGDGASTKSL